MSDEVKDDRCTPPLFIDKRKGFNFALLDEAQRDLFIAHCAYERCGSFYEFKRDSYPHYVVEVPLNGKCTLKINKQEFMLEKGMLGAFSPESSHYYRVVPESPMEHIYIAFNGNEAQSLFEKCEFGAGKVVKLSETGVIIHLAQLILKHGIEKNEFSHELCCIYLKALLLECRGVKVAADGACLTSKDHFSRCSRYIEENFSDILLPSEVASACNISVRHMAKVFRQNGSIPPSQFIMKTKLIEAERLLLTTSFLVKDIAEMVGFVDPYHFSRNFKIFYGVSPQDYRNVHAG